jgi:hypothetical protein
MNQNQTADMTDESTNSEAAALMAKFSEVGRKEKATNNKEFSF